MPAPLSPTASLLGCHYRLARLADAFGTFTTDGLQDEQQAAALQRRAQQQQQQGGRVLDPMVVDALKVVFGRRGTYIQVGGCLTPVPCLHGAMLECTT